MEVNEVLLARVESWLRAADHNLSADNATGWSRAYFTGCHDTLMDVRELLTSERESLYAHTPDHEPEDDNYKELIEQAIADEFYRRNPEGE